MMAAAAMRKPFAQAVRHLARARAQYPPGQQASQDGVADADPRGGHAVFPTELTGVAHEDDGGEVAGAERERAQPRPHVAAAQDEPVDASGVSSAVDADAHRHADENKHHAYLFDHESSYRFMRAARRRALFPKKASPVLLRVPRPDVSRETFVPLSHCNAMNCFTWNIASGRARAVAHMTLPERNTRRHDADEAPRANPCARGIDRNNRKRHGRRFDRPGARQRRRPHDGRQR